MSSSKLVIKVIKCKIIGLTGRKRALLEQEYRNFQAFLHGDENAPVYSATRQQGKRLYRRVKPGREYPLVIRSDLMDIRKTNNKLATYWARIPVKNVRGGIKVALAHRPFRFEEWDVGTSRITRSRSGEFFLHVTIKKETRVKDPGECKAVIALDLGARNPVVSVAPWRARPRFHGKKSRGIRGKYYRTRKRLGELKKPHAIKKLKGKEKRLVNQ